MSRKYTDIQLLRSLVERGDEDVSTEAVVNILTLLYKNATTLQRDDVIDAIASAYSEFWSFGDE